ncbi:gluzincin family metallopeptidase [Orenia marismortui]|uniref:hypothetical protein n=1 Tax=Orenia marismortui TaxID=46469 RepID=UPI00036DB0D9|nr:hypothetical protein [Orenia marismortui]
MRRKLYTLVMILIIVFLSSSINVVNANILNWRTYETEDFLIFYPQGYEWQAKETLYYLEKNKDKIKRLTGNEEDFQTHVVIQDIGMVSNGYANPLNYKLGIYTNNPATDSRISGIEDWFRYLNVHEFTHMSHLTNTSGSAETLSNIFGNTFSPNLHAPEWIIEGITVYNESQTSQYEGRLHDGYFDAIVAAKVQAGDLPSISEATYEYNDFPRGKGYIYGGAIFEYLSQGYGEDKFAEFFDEYGSYWWTPFIGDLFPTIGIDKAAKKVYGYNLEELFAEWKAYERKHYKNWKVDGQKIIDTSKGDIYSLTVFDDKLYYFKSDLLRDRPFSYRKINKLCEYDLRKSKERILKVNLAPGNGSITKVGRKLYYSILNISNNFSNVDRSGKGTIATLYSYDLDTAKSKKLFSDDFKDFLVSDNGEVIYVKDSKEEFGSEVWSYYNGVKKLIGNVNSLITELRRYQDKSIVVSKEKRGSWGINYLDLEQMELSTLIDSNYGETDINLRNDKLYFSSNYDGYQAIYEYDLLDKDLYRLTDKGYSINGVVNNDRLYFVGVSSDGKGIYQRAKVEKNYDLVAAEKEAESDKIDLEELGIDIKKGRGFGRSLKYLFKPHTRFIFPIIASGEDALGFNSYTMTYGNGGVNFNWNSKMLMPVKLSFSSNREDDDRENTLNLAYPLYESDLGGLSLIQVDYTTDFSDSTPGLMLNFSYPRQDLSIYLQKDIADQGFNSELNYSYSFDNSSISFKANKFEEFDQDEMMRGFDFDEADNGYQANLDYTHKLIEIRDGAWNPNFFIADVYGNIFADYYKDEDIARDRFSYGYEFIFETGLGSHLYLKPTLGFSLSEDFEDDIASYLRIELSF